MRVLRVGLLIVGWLIVAVLGLVALLRVVARDSAEPLVVLDVLTLVIYLPAWAGLALVVRVFDANIDKSPASRVVTSGPSRQSIMT